MPNGPETFSGPVQWTKSPDRFDDSVSGLGPVQSVRTLGLDRYLIISLDQSRLSTDHGPFRQLQFGSVQASGPLIRTTGRVEKHIRSKQETIRSNRIVGAEASRSLQTLLR